MSLLVHTSPGRRWARAGLWSALVILLLVAQMDMHCHHGTAALRVAAHSEVDAGPVAVAQHIGHDRGTDDDHHGGGAHQDACQHKATPVASGLLVAAGGPGLVAITTSAMAQMARAVALLVADRYAAGAPRGPTALAGTQLLLSISVLQV